MLFLLLQSAVIYNIIYLEATDKPVTNDCNAGASTQNQNKQQQMGQPGVTQNDPTDPCLLLVCCAKAKWAAEQGGATYCSYSLYWDIKIAGDLNTNTCQGERGKFIF